MFTTPSNAATAKLSPLLPLTPAQAQLVDRIFTFTTTHLNQPGPAMFAIYGDAGTGKSVVLAHLFNRIQEAARTQATSPLAGTENYFLVNHPEILKVYREIAGHQPHLFKKDIQRPTSLINQISQGKRQADVLVIDEAHLLLSQPDHYNNFYGHNQLASLMATAKVIIVVFDETQVLRLKSYWTEQRLEALMAPVPHEVYRLTHQFRMQASDDLVRWINDFTHQRLRPLPSSGGTNYDLRVFADAEKMRQAIVARNQEVGLSRIVSTSGYPSTLDRGKHYITEGAFHLPWDQYNYTATPWAELPQTINEVGSIYTCQGFDLNYVGIILGPPIGLDEHEHLVIHLDRYTDVEAFKRRDDLTDPQELTAIKQRLILNSINVLMKRGVKGLYIYAHDPRLNHYLQQGRHLA
ncbi:DUF2075 domain-containing protein [Levilactobacillus suantsaiihabitans]|uniref:DUF2075 domain-containing protein n=1 Tax=Levilactobacillus suantsaiihabitans TaxID=2487722 RepID=A0A4Z0JBI8_9LACO|nr:DUF2075 domain-containing protein [Levilactobacillus suantsaiihabitans]TGD18884.1 DUF2075 domain-containing protein [Levilactobacillus suantsaiihabitans]